MKICPELDSRVGVVTSGRKDAAKHDRLGPVVYEQGTPVRSCVKSLRSVHSVACNCSGEGVITSGRKDAAKHDRLTAAKPLQGYLAHKKTSPPRTLH